MPSEATPSFPPLSPIQGFAILTAEQVKERNRSVISDFRSDRGQALIGDPQGLSLPEPGRWVIGLWIPTSAGMTEDKTAGEILQTD